tara:strand:- start:119 stop:589 length:471 start_codon:yes stop_codon:yes gene_type:complete
MTTQFLPSTIHLTPGIVQVHYVRPLYNRLVNINEPDQVYQIVKQVIPPTRMDVKEFFYALYLTNSNRLLGLAKIGEGTVKGVVVNNAEIFQIAFSLHASAIILCHNHPSGNLTVSDADITATRKIQEVCKYLDITLVDHMIITSEGFCSMANCGEI